MTLADLQAEAVLGQGAFGTVKLVYHKVVAWNVNKLTFCELWIEFLPAYVPLPVGT